MACGTTLGTDGCQGAIGLSTVHTCHSHLARARDLTAISSSVVGRPCHWPSVCLVLVRGGGPGYCVMGFRAILINLDRSTDRLARMRAEFDRAGIAFERFRAVNGADLLESVRCHFCDEAGKITSPLRLG